MFLHRYKEQCSDGNLRLISHSLGAQVVFPALARLHSWDAWSSKFDSVHLLAVAIDDESPTADHPEYYPALQDEVGTTFNYFNRQDSPLGYAYEARERDRVLGRRSSVRSWSYYWIRRRTSPLRR